MLFTLVKSWVLGIAIAAPIGPIGFLCIKKTLEFGLRGTMSVGLGAALADSVYGIIASTGLTAISYFLLEQKMPIKIIGGLFLLYLAFKELKHTTVKAPISKNNTSKLVKLTAEVFFLTMMNPMTILSFIGIFASISDITITPIKAIYMVLGIFLGSMTWWLILGLFILKMKHKLPENYMRYISVSSALILVGFGLWAILSNLIT